MSTEEESREMVVMCSGSFKGENRKIGATGAGESLPINATKYQQAVNVSIRFFKKPALSSVASI